MQDAEDDAGGLTRKVGRAASYLHKLMQEGNVRMVTTDLLGLGTMGQLVALELYKRLTVDKREALEREMSTRLDHDPRIRERRYLSDLVRLDEHAKATAR